MHLHYSERFAWALRHWWYRVRVAWYTADGEAWLIAGIIGLIVATFGLVLGGVFAHQDEVLQLARQHHKQNLTCLARNVYFEARGEPVAGQLAVAEVTLNRKASGRFSKTICGVVYEQNWDPVRNRYVGAFSWTELDALPEPEGQEWERAWKVAEAVYYRRELPAVEGALYYHASYINPSWAKEKEKLASIGKHVFYK